LRTACFDMKQLSIIGRDYHTEEHVVGDYDAGDRMKVWGKLGVFWGDIWGLLFGWAYLRIPGVGPLLVAGPVVSAVVGGLEGAAAIRGLNALGAGLISIGIPKKSVLAYESEIGAGKFALIAHGTPEDVATAKGILKNNGADAIDHYKSAV
jgi:hypothetical protein